MHLPKLPTVFEKGGETRKAYFTVQARELLAAGWVERVEENEAEVKEQAVEKKKAARRTKKAIELVKEEMMKPEPVVEQPEEQVEEI